MRQVGVGEAGTSSPPLSPYLSKSTILISTSERTSGLYSPKVTNPAMHGPEVYFWGRSQPGQLLTEHCPERKRLFCPGHPPSPTRHRCTGPLAKVPKPRRHQGGG